MMSLQKLASKSMTARVRPALQSLTQVRAYHENIVEHYENPRNVGSLDKDDSSVGTVSVFFSLSRDDDVWETLSIFVILEKQNKADPLFASHPLNLPFSLKFDVHRDWWEPPLAVT